MTIPPTGPNKQKGPNSQKSLLPHLLKKTNKMHDHYVRESVKPSTKIVKCMAPWSWVQALGQDQCRHIVKMY